MLFPHCKFSVLVPHGVIFTGQRVDGTLVIDSPEPIPRAEQIDLVYTAVAWAGYGSGKQRTVLRREMFRAPLVVPLPAHVLPAGAHEFPFAIDVPPWLPCEFAGNDCGIHHEINTRVEVAWAIDPKAALRPILAMPPGVGVAEPVIVRSPLGFHDSIVVEVTLGSSVVSQDTPLTGQIALRGGLDARFDAVDLSLINRSRIVMGRGDTRRGAGFKIRIPAGELRSGEAAPFTFPTNSALAPTFRGAFFDIDTILVVSVDVPWARDPEMVLPLTMLPAGSRIHGTGGVAPVGSARVRQSAAAMARRTGLSEGRPPVLIEGMVGPVGVRVLDAPRAGNIGISAELTFPDLELGIEFRPRGMLDGLRDKAALPPKLGDRFFLSFERFKDAPGLDSEALNRFGETSLTELHGADELHFSDQHLQAHFSLPDDDGQRMEQIAAFIQEKARAIVDAISRLPTPAPCAASMATWQAVAREQNGHYVPSGPSIHGLQFGQRLSDGEERTLKATLTIEWSKSGASTVVDMNLRDAPISESQWATLTGDSPNALGRAVLEIFPQVRESHGGARLERRGFTEDPRVLWPGIEAFLLWVLEARGERRADAPYR